MTNTVPQILQLLKENYPDTRYYLNFTTPLELVVAAILSSQVKDSRVNAATPALFAKYKTAKDYAQANEEELIEYVRSISFCAKKVKTIQKVCHAIESQFAGHIPDTMENLLQLPGIGRKTANAILTNAFDKIVGIGVDTHVIRLAQRLGFTSSKNADKIEKDLMALFAHQEWKNLPRLLKAHGKAQCKPVPLCSKCFLRDICPQTGVEKSK